MLEKQEILQQLLFGESDKVIISEFCAEHSYTETGSVKPWLNSVRTLKNWYMLSSVIHICSFVVCSLKFIPDQSKTGTVAKITTNKTLLTEERETAPVNYH